MTTHTESAQLLDVAIRCRRNSNVNVLMILNVKSQVPISPESPDAGGVGCGVGCRVPPLCCDSQILNRGLQEHACRDLRTSACPGHEVIPSGVQLSDGLAEDEAICIALANNSAFQATVAQLGMAGGPA